MEAGKNMRTLLVAGVLAVIAASICLIFGTLFMAVYVTASNRSNYPNSYLSIAFFNILGFGFGLIGAWFCVKTKNFISSITGISMLLICGLISLAGFITLGSFALDLVIAIPEVSLAAVALVLTEVSKPEYV